MKNLFNTKNISSIGATGNAETIIIDAKPTSNRVQLNESYTDLYSLKIANPENYALPRQIGLDL